MHTESTLSDIYEQLAEQFALARTKALMGERCEALGILQAATLEYTRFREVLSAFPGFYALEYAYTVTTSALQEEQERAAGEAAATVSKTTRKRSRRAA